jgi:copper homeostasis protein
MNSLEIIVETLEDALAAESGGASQLDLKAHYPCSGITPSIGTVATIFRQVKIPIVMMIRPHARSFQASAGDVEISAADIQAARLIGVRDFMLGFLTATGEIDADATRHLQRSAGDCRIHMHLGWELCQDPWKALEDIIDLGFSSIHTGGLSTQGKAFGGSALEAAANIKRIVKIIDGRMQIFLAGSVSVENAAVLIQTTGITNLHCGRGVRTPPTAEGGVDAEKVRRLRKAQLEGIGQNSF